MKKAAIVFTYIATILGLIGVVAFTIYSVIYIVRCTAHLMLIIGNESLPENAGLDLMAMIMFLLLDIYFVFVTFTGLLSKRVIEDNRLDKIKPFGILSIIFFNPVGGILTLRYNSWLKKELERTAPKGKRKEAKKE